jgi:hypothetical protein
MNWTFLLRLIKALKMYTVVEVTVNNYFLSLLIAEFVSKKKMLCAKEIIYYIQFFLLI